MEMKVMWDLCSGLGGSSQAFVDSPEWQVVRIETNPILQGVEFTHDLDVNDWKDWIDDLISTHGRPDFIWCSPPCREFSRAYSAPGPVAEREGRDFEPCLNLMYACEDVINYVEPAHWIIENVVGAINHFTPHLGDYFQKVGPFVLWGRCPALLMPPSWKHSKSTNDVHSGNPMRSNIRAMIPYEVSMATLQAITNQLTLDRWG